jgi:hypothetical protein
MNCTYKLEKLHMMISSEIYRLLDLNNWKTFLTIKNVQGAKSISKDFENELHIDVKLFTVLYADDTVLLTDSSEETLKYNLYKQFFLVYYYTSVKLHGTFYPYYYT